MDALINALKDQDANVCSSAFYALGEIKDKRAVDELVIALKHQHPDVRRKAAEALGKIGDKRAVDGLVVSLNDQEQSVRLAAADALYKIGGEHKIDGLIVKLTHEFWQVRREAADALGYYGDVRAVDGLVAALKDTDTFVRGAATKALGKIGDARTMDALGATLKDDQNASVRREAAEALGNIRGARVLDALIATLKDEQDSSVRNSAVEALVKIGGERAVDGLVAALKDPNINIRLRAAEALGNTRDARAVDGLVAALKDQDWHVVSKAAYALGGIGDARAEHALIVAIKDMLSREELSDSNRISSTLCEIFASIRQVAAPALTQLLKHENKLVRRNASYAIIALKENVLQTLPTLIDIISDLNFEVPIWVLVAIGSFGPAAKDAVQPLLAAWKRTPRQEHIVYVNINFAQTLSEIGSPEAIDPILTSLFAYQGTLFSEEVTVLKNSLLALVPVSNLTVEMVNWTVETSTYECDFRGDQDPLLVDATSRENAVKSLCAVDSQTSSNILIMIANKKDFDGGMRQSSISFSYERRLAMDELKRRGNPPYKSEAFYTRA